MQTLQDPGAAGRGAAQTAPAPTLTTTALRAVIAAAMLGSTLGAATRQPTSPAQETSAPPSGGAAAPDAPPVAAGPVAVLPDDDRSAIQAVFGGAFLGQALPSGAVNDPVAALGLAASRSLRFDVVAGGEAPATVDGVVSDVERSGTSARWRFTADDRTWFLQQAANGQIGIVSVTDRDMAVLSSYDPPQPLLGPGTAAGGGTTVTCAVQVYDLSDPTRVAHTGSLTVQQEYVGRWRVTTPGGAFDALLVRLSLTGQVGPAKVEDVQHWFFAPGKGPVAWIEKSDVSAFLFYDKRTTNAILLAGPPG